MAVEFVFDVVIESSPRLLKALYTGLCDDAAGHPVIFHR
jgi:hypothetical protein